MLYIFNKALYQNQLFMPYEFYLLIIMPLILFGIPYISEKILFLIYENKDCLTDYKVDKVRSSTQLISCLLGMGIMIVCWNPDINTKYANSIKNMLSQ